MISETRQRRALLTALVGTLLAVAAALLMTPKEAWAAATDVRVLSSTQTVSPRNPSPTGSTDSAGQPAVRLKAARNEFESFQVLVQADGAGIANLRVDPGAPLKQIDPATGQYVAGGATVPADNLTFYREHFINVSKTSDNEGATGMWPDALIPEKDFIYEEDRKAFPYALGAGQKAVAWIDVLVPKDQPAGTYKGTVLVKNDASPVPSAGGQTLKEIPITLEVKGFTIPSTSTLDSAFMMNSVYPAICGAHRAATCDTPEEKWQLHAQYARAGLENRISIPSAFPGGLNQAPSTQAGSPFEKYSVPLIKGLNASAAPGDPTRGRLDGARLTSIGAYWQCSTESDTCMPAWKTLAERHGFADRFFLYTCDEIAAHVPCSSWDVFKQRAADANREWPGVRQLLTKMIQEADANDADQWVDLSAPLVNHMDGKNCCGSPYIGNQRDSQAHKNFLDPSRNPAGSAPNELWMYTSNMSFGSDDNTTASLWDGWPGYAIDQPDTQARAMGWMSYYYGTTGELYYQTTQKLTTAWTDQYEQGGNGDGNLFYPGVVGGNAANGVPDIGGTHDIPVESLRLKRIRDGREDYEYMVALEKQGKAQEVQNVIRSIYGDKDYLTRCPVGSPRPSSPDGGCGDSAMYTTPSAAAMDQARLQLWNLLAGDTLPETTITSGPANGSTSSTDSATFGFTSNKAGASMECKLDAEAFSTCTSPKAYQNLPNGPHTFQVRATDSSGADPSPATRTWTVQTIVPETCQGKAATKLGTSAGETLNGTPEDDVILGLGGDDTINGLGGNDTICGGDDYDSLSGGPGDDALLGGNGEDALYYRNAPSGVNVDLAAGNATGEGADSLSSFTEVYGSDHADTMKGGGETTSSVYLAGYAGNDTIIGSPGNDWILGMEGDDTLDSLDGTADTGSRWNSAYGVECGPGSDKLRAEAQARAEGDTVNPDCEPAATDTAQPTITGMRPSDGSTIRDRTPIISAYVSDDSAGLEKSDIVLSVDGNTIPASAWNYDTTTGKLIHPSGRLSLKGHRVTIVATDDAGLVGSRSWRFTIRR